METISKSQADLYSNFKSLQSYIEKKHKSFNIQQLVDSFKLEQSFNIVKSLINDLEFCFKKKIPQRLWALIRIFITSYQQQHDHDKFMSGIDKFYEKQFSMMKSLVKVLLEKHDEQKLEKFEPNQVISKICVYYGQLLQNRQKVALTYNLAKNPKSLQLTSNFYLKAINIYPYAGSSYSRLAELTAFNNDFFSACYWSMRAETADEPEQKDQKLLMILDKLSKQTIPLEFKQVSDGLRCLCLHLTVFYNQKNIDNSFLAWDQLLKKIVVELKQPNDLQLTILSFCIHLCLNNVYQSILAGKLKKAYHQIKENFNYRSTIRNNFYIILSILEIFNKIQNPYLRDASMLLMPIINFWVLYPNILKLLLEDFKQLEGGLAYLYSRFLPLKTKDRLNYKIFDREVDLLGWIVLRQSYQDRIKEIQRDNEVKISWIIDGFKKLGTNLEQNKSQCFKAKYPSGGKITINKIEATKDKNLIVVDGRNVAVKHGDHNGFSSKGLSIISQFWRKKGYQIVIILPEYCFSSLQITKRRQQQMNQKTLPDDISVINKLKKEGIAVGVPDKDYDDAYIIEFAMSKNAFIISNDNFRDFKQDQKVSMSRKIKIREYLKDHLMSFTFIKDDFIPNPEFIKNKNIL